VTGDVHEGGARLKLNYGHTLGHAIEVSTVTEKGDTYRHGEGVALGIMAAVFIARNHLGLTDETAAAQQRIFEQYQLPVSVDSTKIGFDRGVLIKECLRNVKKDKKRKDHAIRMVLVKEIGRSTVYNDVPFALIEQAFQATII